MPAKSKFDPMQFLYVGIKGCVLALRKSDGSIAWKADLSRGSSFVPIVQDGSRLFAGSGGEITCLDCESGKVLWHNPLKGFGTGYLAIAGGGFPTSAAAAEQAAQAAAAGAAIAAS
jgi:outer membrane protein assembly factor BamB